MNKKFAILAAFFAVLFLVFITQYDFPAYAADPPSVRFSSSTASVNEGDDVTLTVVLSEAYEDDVTVDFRTEGNASADAGSDYTAKNGLVTITAGQTSAQIVISTLTDYENFEGSETFNVLLSNAQNASLGLPSLATVTINDVETFPPIYRFLR